jgi:FkbM family methyltransferase
MKFTVGTVTVDMIEAGDRVCLKGESFEPRSLMIWGELCLRSQTVVDVGAYTGLYAIAAALHGCQVVAIEPMPFNAERLHDNALLNDVREKIDLHRAAASASDGQAKIAYRKAVPFTSGASLVGKGGDRLMIKTIAIDSLGLDRVGAMKIDVERGEPLVLAGARQTIARCKPAILIEVLDDQRKAEVRAALPRYRVASAIDERNWLMVPEC